MRPCLPILAFLSLSAIAATAPSLRAQPATLPVTAMATAPSALTPEAFLGSVGRDIASHFNFEGELQLEFQRPFVPPARVAANWSTTVVEFPTLPSAAMLVRCRVAADGVPAGDVTLVVRASALARLRGSTRQPVTAGAAFDPALLEVRRVDTFRERDVLPSSAGDRSFVFARGVAAGRMLTWRDLSRRPLVRKGGTVEVSAGDGLMLITMKALAMENGAQGDTITVRNPESRRDFAAVVVDENHVQVRF